MGMVSVFAGAFVALALFNYTKIMLFKKNQQPIVQVFDEERK